MLGKSNNDRPYDAIPGGFFLMLHIIQHTT